MHTQACQDTYQRSNLGHDALSCFFDGDLFSVRLVAWARDNAPHFAVIGPCRLRRYLPRWPFPCFDKNDGLLDNFNLCGRDPALLIEHERRKGAICQVGNKIITCPSCEDSAMQCFGHSFCWDALPFSKAALLGIRHIDRASLQILRSAPSTHNHRCFVVCNFRNFTSASVPSN